MSRPDQRHGDRPCRAHRVQQGPRLRRSAAGADPLRARPAGRGHFGVGCDRFPPLAESELSFDTPAAARHLRNELERQFQVLRAPLLLGMRVESTTCLLKAAASFHQLLLLSILAQEEAKAVDVAQTLSQHPRRGPEPNEGALPVHADVGGAVPAAAAIDPLPIPPEPVPAVEAAIRTPARERTP